ncbi:isochorismatase family protein [Pseudaeromonas sp. ZJS20]|uniref:isochorismatase family protein n=1 Tax=Pseudaeromonas aegiceratis TaxID=3153928 RepID=UPI00390C94F1
MTIPTIAAYEMPTACASERVDWRLDPARSVLLIHDMQDYFLDFYDADLAPIPSLLAHLQALVARARQLGIPVVYTAQPAQQSAEERGLLTDMWGPGLPARPEASAIVSCLAPAPQDLVLTKWRYSAFVRSELREKMRQWGRDQLVIGGVYGHIGVLMSACDAFMQDIQPFVLADGIADFSAEEHRLALDYVAKRCGRIPTTDQVLSAWPAALPESAEALRALLAQILGIPPEQLGWQDDLLEWGLDSIRVMGWLGRWQRAGVQLSLAQLAEEPTVAGWWRLLAQEVAHV